MSPRPRRDYASIVNGDNSHIRNGTVRRRRHECGLYAHGRDRDTTCAFHRPFGTNSFTRKPSAVIGASPGAIGTALAQHNLRSVLSFCNSPQMNAPEAYIQFTPG
jgi:hypothetical protein